MSSESSPRVSVKERAREIEKRKSKDAEAARQPLTEIIFGDSTGPGCQETRTRSSSSTSRIRTVVPDASVLLGISSEQDEQKVHFSQLEEVQEGTPPRRSSEGDLLFSRSKQRSTVSKESLAVSESNTTRRGSATDPPLCPVHEETFSDGNRWTRENDNPHIFSSPSKEGEEGKKKKKEKEKVVKEEVVSSGSVQRSRHFAKSGPFKSSARTWDVEARRIPLGPAIFSKQTPDAVAAVSRSSSSSTSEVTENRVSPNPLEEILASLERICDEFDTANGAGHLDVGQDTDSGLQSADEEIYKKHFNGKQNPCEQVSLPPACENSIIRNTNFFSPKDKAANEYKSPNVLPEEESSNSILKNGTGNAKESLVSDKKPVFVSSTVLFITKSDATTKYPTENHSENSNHSGNKKRVDKIEKRGTPSEEKVSVPCCQLSPKQAHSNHAHETLFSPKYKIKNAVGSDKSSSWKKNHTQDPNVEENFRDDHVVVTDSPKSICKPNPLTCLSTTRKLSFGGIVEESFPIALKEQRSFSLGGEGVPKNSSSSFDIEKAKSILAGLDFGKYKRRQHTKDDSRKVKDTKKTLSFKTGTPMEPKGPNSPKSKNNTTPKSASLGHNAKLKDLFEMLKPHSSDIPNRKNFLICRSSSFSTTESLDEVEKDFYSDDSKDAKNPGKKNILHNPKISTLPRRKTPSKKSVKLPSAVENLVSSCPSIAKVPSEVSNRSEADEGLVPDVDTESGNYAAEYESCVFSQSGKRDPFRRPGGHVRSASDVTSVRSSISQMGPGSNSEMAAHDQRKRKKAIGVTSGAALAGHFRAKAAVPGQEPAKSGTGRSLTYPPQRKSSVPEDNQHYTSIDSNGLLSFKPLNNDRLDSTEDSSSGPRRSTEEGEGDDEFFDDLDSDQRRSLLLMSDLSLADSHLCPSEGTIEDSFHDVVDSVMRSPDVQHLSVEDRNLGGNNGKAPKKKHHSDPGSELSSGVNAEVCSVFLPNSVIGSSRSEPDLNDSVTVSSSSSASSSSSSTLGHHRQNRHHHHHHEDEDDDDEHRLHLTVISGTHGGSEPPSSVRTGVKHHVRAVSSGGSYRFLPDVPQTPEPQRSPQEQRRYSKRRLRGPYGEMLEEEMRKSGEKVKPNFNDLSFLQEICASKQQASQQQTMCVETAPVAFPSPTGRPFVSSQSLDDPKSDASPSSAPKRKISANYPLLLDATTVTADGTSADERSIKRSSSSCSQDSTGIGSGNSSDAIDPHVVTNRDNTKKDNSSSVLTSNGLIDFPKMRDSHLDTRTHVVGELYDTEKSYVESLQILANKYMKPLKSSDFNGVVDTSLVDEIFFQIPEILSHHESFLEELKQRLSCWDGKQKIGDIFVEVFTKQQVIDTYTAFINNWKSAKDAIKIASQAKPAFARFLEHQTRDHKGKLTLDALLIMPVQRIPRYELLIKELLKHTPVDHPDHRLLISAQREVHELALKINRMEREAFALEQAQQKLRDIEQLIDGVVDLVQPDRGFLRHEMVHMPGGLGTKKERCLFLFTDVLLITSMKRKTGTIRKPSATSSGSPNNYNSLDMNKYKLLTKFSLDNLDITKSTDNSLRRLLKDIENLEEDMALLNQIGELASNINSPHQALDEAVKELSSSVSKQLAEKQNCDSQLVSLELTVTTQEGVESLTILFSSPEKRTTWEVAFNEAKQKLALSTDRRPPPEFVHPLPIRKTRAGLQFTCAAATLGLNQQGLRDVWVCNSDGYVGQVCVLSLQPEPTVMSCNGVCNSRILTIASIPAATSCIHPIASVHPEKNRWRPTMPDNLTGVSIEVEECDENYVSERTKNGNIQLDSDSSDGDEEYECESADDEKSREDSRKQRGGSLPRDEGYDDMDHRQPTMWLGTEDGCILVYNCNDNIRTKKNKTKFQHSAAIHCIIFLDNRVFVSLANGEIDIYKKDPGGGWSNSDPGKVLVGCAAAPVTRMLAVAGKLWCGSQNMIKVVNTSTLETENSFAVSNDTSRTVLCMVTSGLGVWVALQHSAVLRLFHAVSYECLLDVNVAPAVTKMLAGCDDIIRQHKAACLRVTAVLACKDLLWVGTSAGVILTLPLPHLTSSTTRLDNTPNIAGLPHGHTGHVRFLTCVEMGPGMFLDSKVSRSIRSKDHSVSGRRASTAASAGCRLLVISGGDGYEDFRNGGLGEAAGRDDSTNHLLLWQV